MRIFLTLFYFMMVALFIAVVAYFNQKSGEVSNAPSYTVGVVFKAMDSEHWLSVRSGMMEAAYQHNMKLIVMAPENEIAYAQQNQIIDDLLANDIDALIVSTTNIHHVDEFLMTAELKNIPVFTIDEDIGDSPYIGSDNYKIGEMAAKFMSEELPAGSEVSVFSGSANQNANIQRTQGFVDYIRNNTELKLGTTMAAETQYRQAMLQTERLLNERPQTRGIFITSAIMTLGVIEVTENRLQSPLIIGVDTQNDAIMALKNGSIDAMISQDGHESGRLAIKVVADYLEGKSIERYNYIANELITRENADRYLLQEDF